MSTIKIFLASSDELKPEREMMASLANSLNTVLEQQGVHVIVVEWENLDASMGIHHKQDDYNEKLRDCEMCLVLYWTKFGMYTKTELDTAYKELQAGNNPRKLYVYFKNGAEPTEELKEFRDSFPTRYGHFFTPFENFDTLKAHFLLQFMEYQSQVLINTNAIEIKDGKVVFGGIEYVNLKNVPFAGNNEEYNEIKDEIAELQEDLENLSPDSPRYAKKSEKLQKLQEKLSKMENSLWDTALMITRLSTTKCSERLKRAMDLFSAGDNKGANAILDEVDISKDIEHNINLIKLGNEGKMGLMTNIEEILLKIKTLENSQESDWLTKTENLYKTIINIAESNLSKEVLYNILDSYSILLRKIRRYSSSISILNKMVETGIQENIKEVFIRLGEAYCWISDEKKSDANYDRAIKIDENDIHTKIRCLVGKANNYFRRDKDRSEELYLEALKLQENHLVSTTDRLFFAQILNNLGNIYSYKQNYAEAEQLHLKALKIRRDYEDTDLEESRNLVTYTLKNLGDMYLEQKEYAKAESAYNEAIEIKRELAHRKPYIHNSHLAMCLNVFGKLKTIKKEYELAEEFLKEALFIRRTLANHERKGYINYVARTLDNLGHLYTVTRRYYEAEKLLIESLSIRKEMCSYSKQGYLNELKNCIEHVNYNYSCSGNTESIVSFDEIVKQL